MHGSGLQKCSCSVAYAAYERWCIAGCRNSQSHFVVFKPNSVLLLAPCYNCCRLAWPPPSFNRCRKSILKSTRVPTAARPLIALSAFFQTRFVRSDIIGAGGSGGVNRPAGPLTDRNGRFSPSYVSYFTDRIAFCSSAF